MKRKILALIVGFGAIVITPLLFYKNPSQLLLSLTANFIGGFVAGFIARQKGMLIGLIVSVSFFVFLIIELIHIAGNVGGRIYFPQLNLMYPNLIGIIFGPIGGFLGERISKKLNRSKTSVSYKEDSK